MTPIFLFITAMFLIIAATKTVLFIKNIGDRKLIYWFFFPRYNVIPSSKNSRKYKELQNKLSTILLIIAVFELMALLIMKFAH